MVKPLVAPQPGQYGRASLLTFEDDKVGWVSTQQCVLNKLGQDPAYVTSREGSAQIGSRAPEIFATQVCSSAAGKSGEDAKETRLICVPFRSTFCGIGPSLMEAA
jgi:hypothetical protein